VFRCRQRGFGAPSKLKPGDKAKLLPIIEKENLRGHIPPTGAPRVWKGGFSEGKAQRNPKRRAKKKLPPNIGKTREQNPTPATSGGG